MITQLERGEIEHPQISVGRDNVRNHNMWRPMDGGKSCPLLWGIAVSLNGKDRTNSFRDMGLLIFG